MYNQNVEVNVVLVLEGLPPVTVDCAKLGSLFMTSQIQVPGDQNSPLESASLAVNTGDMLKDKLRRRWSNSVKKDEIQWGQ